MEGFICPRRNYCSSKTERIPVLNVMTQEGSLED
jgi:hypothetical protein